MSLSTLLGRKEEPAPSLPEHDVWRMKLESATVDESKPEAWRHLARRALDFGKLVPFKELAADGWSANHLFGMAAGTEDVRPAGFSFRSLAHCQLRYRAKTLEFSTFDAIAGVTVTDKIQCPKHPTNNRPIWDAEPVFVPEHLRPRKVTAVNPRLSAKWVGDGLFRLIVLGPTGIPADVDLDLAAITKLLGAIGKKGEKK